MEETYILERLGKEDSPTVICKPFVSKYYYVFYFYLYIFI